MVWNRAPPYTHIISEPASDIFQNTRWKPAMRGPTGRLTGGHTGQRAWSAEQFARPRSKRTALGRVGGATSGDGNRLLGLESMAIAADQEGIAAAVPPPPPPFAVRRVRSSSCGRGRIGHRHAHTSYGVRSRPISMASMLRDHTQPQPAGHKAEYIPFAHVPEPEHMWGFGATFIMGP